MPGKEYLQPEGLVATQPYGFTQVVVSPPGKTLYISGQVAWDETGKVGSDDFEEQVKKALENLDLALKAGGAARRDVAHIRVYIPNHDREKLMPLARQLEAFFGKAAPPAQTLIGVQALALPEFLIEIEATAVVEE